MGSRHFFVQLLITGVLFVIGNMGIQWATRNSIPRQVLAKGDQAQGITDLFIGDSLIARGVDEAAFASAKLGSKPLNLGIGSTTCVEHLIIYRWQERHGNVSVHYGFADMMLTRPPVGGWSTLIARRAFVYYTDLNLALSFYLPNDPVHAAILQIVAKIPILVERAVLWEKVEHFRRMLAELGMPRQEITSLGRVKDFSALESVDPVEFADQCMSVVRNRLDFNGPIAALLRSVKDRGTTLTMILMPMTKKHRQIYYETPEWAAYQAYIVDQIQKSGGRFLDASDWIADDGFEDAVHLNPTSAKVFSAKLARKLMEVAP